METLTAAEAEVRIIRMTAGAPTLPPEDIAILTELARQTEYTADAEPVADFDLNLGAAEGWSWKAALLAEQRALGAEGANLQNQQLFEHALTMEDMYRRRSVGASTITSSKFTRTDVLR